MMLETKVTVVFLPVSTASVEGVQVQEQMQVKVQEQVHNLY